MNTCQLEIQDAPQSIPLPEPAPADRFRATLVELTPRLYVTGVLIGINLLVFLLMALTGVGPFETTVSGLVQWGANYGPKTTNGEWWRLFTAIFVHLGLVHLLLNMAALIQIGLVMERLLGNLGFTVVYLATGVAGALTSVASHPQVASAGASGAVFGLYGALLGYLMLQPRTIPSEILGPLAKGALGVIAYNVAYGFAKQGTDVAAHFGGLAYGFFCGLILSIPLTPDAPSRRHRRAAILTVVSTLLFGAIAAGTPRSADFLETLGHFEKVEDKAVTSYNSALEQFRAGTLKAPEFAALLERDVMPAWNAEKERLGKIKGLNERQSRLQSLLLNYIAIRGDAWSTLASGLHADDGALVKASFEKQKEATAAIEEISRFAGSVK